MIFFPRIWNGGFRKEEERGKEDRDNLGKEIHHPQTHKFKEENRKDGERGNRKDEDRRKEKRENLGHMGSFWV